MSDRDEEKVVSAKLVQGIFDSQSDVVLSFTELGIEMQGSASVCREFWRLEELQRLQFARRRFVAEDDVEHWVMVVHDRLAREFVFRFELGRAEEVEALFHQVARRLDKLGKLGILERGMRREQEAWGRNLFYIVGGGFLIGGTMLFLATLNPLILIFPILGALIKYGISKAETTNKTFTNLGQALEECIVGSEY